jgi:hypothetical protein
MVRVAGQGGWSADEDGAADDGVHMASARRRARQLRAGHGRRAGDGRQGPQAVTASRTAASRRTLDVRGTRTADRCNVGSRMWLVPPTALVYLDGADHAVVVPLSCCR